MNPAIILSGASGFVGRSLLEDLKEDYRIFAIARRSQRECNAPVHPNIAWIRADITDYKSLERAFREIKTAGGADFLFHLAAFYEFADERREQYGKTNIEGTKNVISLAEQLELKLFVFSSSVAACSFPNKGEFLNESSLPDGEHIYAWSKREGEKLIKEASDKIPTCIVRLGAVYSDWCEFPPLYMFLNTWLSKIWKSKILAGKGESAIPYVHIRDIVEFFRKLLCNYGKLKNGQILIASTNGSTNHLQLFNTSTRYFFGKQKNPFLMPKIISGLGLIGMNLIGRLTKNPPFERPWMYNYIDLKLDVDSKKTFELIDWKPADRYLIDKRMPFLVERLKSEPHSWHAKNLAALRKDPESPELMVYNVLSEYEDRIFKLVIDRLEKFAGGIEDVSFNNTDKTELIWFVKFLVRLLLTSLHSHSRMLILNYFEVSSMNRFESGYSGAEIIYILSELNNVVLDILNNEEDLEPFQNSFYDFISMPIEFGIDEIQHQYGIFVHRGNGNGIIIKTKNLDLTARSQLEETIWDMLVHRK